jgi:Ca2+-transporting ATPase
LIQVLLSSAAIVSLALGIFQDIGPARVPGEPQVDWVEGVAILVAILVVVSLLSLSFYYITNILQVVVGSVNDWQKERQFQTLNDKTEERGVKVIRGGVETVIDIKVRHLLLFIPLLNSLNFHF